MMYGTRRPPRLVALFVALTLLACAEREAPPPVLTVGDVAYTEDELGLLTHRQREALADLAAFGQIVAEDRLAEFGAPFIEREELALLLQKLATEISVRAAGMNEEALRDAYAAAPEYELTVRHLVVMAERWRTDEERAAARARAAAALRRIEAGEDFATVAGQVSEEPGAERRGGLLQPGRRGTWVPEFWEAASALQVGAHSGVVETEYGYHVLQLDAREPVPFDEVRDHVLSRFVDLAAAAGRAETWADREAAALRTLSENIVAWREGAAADTIALASWPAGRYSGGDFGRYLLTFTPAEREKLGAARDVDYERVVAGAARNALLAARAAAMGIRLTAAESASVRDRWVARAEEWATALGFAHGMSDADVAAAAVAALSATQQSARIAREALFEHSAALRAVHPVYFAAPPTPAEANEDGPEG